MTFRPRAATLSARTLCALLAAALVALADASGCGGTGPGRPLALGGAPPPSHRSRVVVILLENTEYGEVIASKSAPYLNSLARHYGLLTQSYAITHPSLPNYLALTSGATDGISSDCTACSTGASNLIDQLEGAHVSWGAYLEGAPRACYDEASSGSGYAKRHNPFAYYDDIASSRSRCRKLMPFGALAGDIRGRRLASFVWITPNLCDDGHDCPLSDADRFLADTVPALLPELGPHGFLIVTWDEGNSDAGCCGAAAGGHIATVVAGPGVRRGARSATPIDHYGILASIERAFGLGLLAGARDPRSGSIDGLFVQPPRLR